MRATAEERFWKYVDKNGPGGCWVWTGHKNNGGYGQFFDGTRQVLAHRFSWELAHHRVIPEGMQADHLCRNRACVNPAHLEPVTQRVNLLRGNGFAGENSRKKTCPKGHPYSGDNVYVDQNGWRECRTCMRERANKYRAAHPGYYARRRALAKMAPGTQLSFWL